MGMATVKTALSTTVFNLASLSFSENACTAVSGGVQPSFGRVVEQACL
jgi:hypothetical protein